MLSISATFPITYIIYAQKAPDSYMIDPGLSRIGTRQPFTNRISKLRRRIMISETPDPVMQATGDSGVFRRCLLMPWRKGRGKNQEPIYPGHSTASRIFRQRSPLPAPVFTEKGIGGSAGGAPIFSVISRLLSARTFRDTLSIFVRTTRRGRR